MNSENKSWITTYEINHKNWKIQYIYSFYFSIVTMITVGYGDIIPQNEVEKVFCIFMVIFSCGIFGFFLNRVGIIIQEMFKKDDDLRFIISNLIINYIKNGNFFFNLKSYFLSNF